MNDYFVWTELKAITIECEGFLVKGDSKAIAASLAKVEPKREKVFAEADSP